MRSMFGIRYFALSGLGISWHCHFIGLHPMLMYYTPSGQALISPEGVYYPNDGCGPSDKASSITSPQGAIYTSEAVTPLANKKEAI